MPRESRAARQRRARSIVRRLFKAHPDAHCELDHENPYQLLVATILSAQSTDKLVNSVTPELFRRFPSARRLSTAPSDELEKLVHKTGFYRQKTRTLLGSATALVRHHAGRVPETMDALVALPGVGRKTANVVLGNCFDTPGIVVDAHVARLAGRMQLTRERDPVKIERDLMKLVPEKDWTRFSHAMIFHGRRICDARAPQCEACTIQPHCPFPRQRRRPARSAPGRGATGGRARTT